MEHSNWTEADSHKAKQIWEAYQKQYNLSERIGQTVGIDPKSSRIWFGDSIQAIVQQRDKEGLDSPLFFQRVGDETYFRRLPEDVKEKARKNYRLWRQDSNHPSLQFKRVHTREPIYSVRIGIGWRALGLRENNRIYWFWIGPHAEYEKLLNQL